MVYADHIKNLLYDIYDVNEEEDDSLTEAEIVIAANWLKFHSLHDELEIEEFNGVD